MIKTEELLKTHRFVGGNQAILNAGTVELFEPHMHTAFDNSSFRRNMLRRSDKVGIGKMVDSNHDVVTFDDTRRERDKQGLEIEIFPGMELATLPLAPTGEGRLEGVGERHILIMGRTARDARTMRREFRPLMSMTELVPVAERNGLLVAIPHPGLRQGKGISFTEREIEIMAKRGILPPIAEYFSGGAAMIDRYSTALGIVNRIPSNWLKMKMPVPGSNETARKIIDAHDDSLSPMSGSDAHDVDLVGAGLNVIPVGIDPYDAILNRENAVMERKKIGRYKLHKFAITGIRGGRLSPFPKDEDGVLELLERKLPEEIFAGIIRKE